MRLRVLLLVSVALASGCSSVPRGGYYQDDGPHRRPEVDVSKVPDAVPRREPHNERNNRPYTVFGVNYQPLKSSVKRDPFFAQRCQAPSLIPGTHTGRTTLG